MTTPALPPLRLATAPDPAPGRARALPAALVGTASRGNGAGALDPILGNVAVAESWDIGPRARGDAGREVKVEPDARLLALEAADGTTVFIRADALAERLDRLAATRPELRHDDGSLDLAALRPRDAQTRSVGDWVWRRLSALVVKEDDLSAQARRKLAELTGTALEDLAVAACTHAGAKAIVWAIEERGRQAPGLYPWDGGAIEAQTPLTELAPAVKALANEPGLIFIHGTGSHTLGGFGQLPGTRSWQKLADGFDGRLFGFEHHSFSESPIDNALALAQVLPEGAQFSIVTHSRGGLVGDLLCIDASPDNAATLAALVLDYRPAPRHDAPSSPDARADRERFVQQEQAKLAELFRLLGTKRFRIARYVRVACPARGTALLTDNLEVFLSGLLNLIRKAGGWAAGAAAGAAAGFGAGAAAKAATDKGIAVLTRIVVEIANRRLDPQLLPGIEAMLPDSAMGMLLASAPHRADTRMAIVAGDIEGGGLAKRLGTMFTDWMFFDKADNDLVVDTASMYGGLAYRAQAQAIFVQGENVNHFRYFRDDTATADGLPLPTALLRWLTDAEPAKLPEWATRALPAIDPDDRVAPPDAPASRGGGHAPILVVLPGIMGSHLKADRRRVWLAPLDLARGSLGQIAFDSEATVAADGLVSLAYGKLVERLGKTHRVELVDYDWRQPIASLGKQLADRLTKLLDDNPDTAVRILAHSMGGLVVRAAIAHRPSLWDALVARPEGRLVMLGTPNHGSHLFVETLLGQSDTIRLLARLDFRHKLQQILDIVAGFPGAVHLLPAPGFLDTGNTAVRDYYRPETWRALADINHDLWFGRALGGKPTAQVLEQAAAFWQTVADTGWVAKAPERIAYVFGQSDNTPCGIVEQQGGGILLRGTSAGDGSVTWASGRLAKLPDDRQWLMPVDHMGLTSTEDYFDDIESLLARGTPRTLGRLPVSRGGTDTAAVREYRAGPPAGYPSPPEATARLLGGRLRPARSRPRSLKVSVSAMDLRFVHIPVLCGHYRGDPIAAAEGAIDRHLVRGALSQRQRLGIHTGELGNASIVLMPRTPAERHRQTGRGAVVVGLGEMGKLTADGVTEAVRGGVLRYLLHAADRYGEEQAGTPAARPPEGGTLRLKLASLLIGTNSALQLDVAESVKAVVLGVLMANRDFADGESSASPDANARRAQVAELQFIEVFHDSAISAAHAVRQLGASLQSELRQMKFALEAADELFVGDGVRQRLSVSPFSDYWPRLVVCDADRDEAACPPDSTAPRFQPPIPPEHLRQLLRIYGCADALPDGALPQPFWLDDAPTLRFATRLKFTYMGDKARSENIVDIRQPGLVEKLCDDRLKSRSPTLYAKDSGFGTTLFQLLVPQDFKADARQANNLLLMVDETTANLPWEMLETDGSPMVLHTRVVRQFITGSFRRQVVRTDSLSACVIAEPATEGFHAQFGGPGWKPAIGADGQPEPDCLAPLPGAAAEADTVQQVLSTVGYEIALAPRDTQAADVLTRLHARPYRLLMISAHGVHGLRAADGTCRSGVVLSNGLLLTAAEIRQMECVPDLVFLNCCHLGKIGTGGSRLAASLARELIDMGVRCVVAAGWEVHDGAARTFIETFFAQMAQHDASFGEAITAARKATFEAHPDHNTWGAYQAYGDPAFQLKVHRNPASDDAPMCAPNELIDWIEQRRIECRLPDAAPRGRASGGDFRHTAQRVRTRLGHVPDHWARLPDVQHALARLYAEYGQDGFEHARKAWQQAIGSDASRGLVPLSAIEQLANLEARQAERLSVDTPDDAALALADCALARLRHLIALAAEGPDPEPGTAGRNLERQAILGSALKRKAVVLARCGKPWAEVAPVLVESRDAYARCQGTPDSAPGWNPYSYLNRLQLDALLGATTDLRQESQTCQDVSAVRFQQSYDFFDAAMWADAQLACWLHTGEGSVQALATAYRNAIQGVGATPRERESVTAQIRILGDLLKCRAPGDADRAAALAALATDLANDTPAAPSPNTPPPPGPASAVGTPKAGAGKKKKT